MKSDWLTRALLVMVAILLVLNLLRPAAPPAFALRAPAEPGNLVNLGGGLTMVYTGDEVVLLGAQKVFDRPFDDHRLSILARESLTE